MAAASANSDVLFQDENVCILNPSSKRGILVFTISDSWNICDEGLYSHNELRKVHPELGLKNRNHIDPTHNDLIFFRAPYNSDVSTFESSYDGISPAEMLGTYIKEAIAVIRIDPDKTFVFSSEIRAIGHSVRTIPKSKLLEDLEQSRIPMTKYLKIINEYSTMSSGSKKIISNLRTYEKRLVSFDFEVKYHYM